MNKTTLEAPALRPAGYAALIDRYALKVLPHWHESVVATSGTHHREASSGIVQETYPPSYWPGDGLGDQLEFALKYDGVNLGILASLFRCMDVGSFTDYIRSKPIGKYARRLWFLYEFISGDRLPLLDLDRGNYVDLLEPADYYTNLPYPVRRQRINNNLLGLGNRQFCPMVRRTEVLQQFEVTDLRRRCQQVVAAYSPELLQRALSYLYTKETKSSFEIEHLQPNPTRIERFVSLLQLAQRQDFCSKPELVDLQNRIIDDARFQSKDYRTDQNYVGESVRWQKERVHFVCPKPADLPSLMEGLIDTHQFLVGVHAVVHAAIIAYGFVFLHPFEDGNGRIHRFLIHNILALRGFTPQGIMFPVSAAMVKHTAAYDASLEAFSRPLLGIVDYKMDPEGRMTVLNETVDWYRFIDMTAQVEALFRFIEQTIDTELATELDFLASYDQTKKTIQEIVDLPDRQIDLFIRCCLQNRGRLSARKRAGSFAMLTDDEVAGMEAAVQAAYGDLGGEG